MSTRLADYLKGKKYDDPFGWRNARETSPDFLVDHFVATDLFWDRFKYNNELIIGTRGSGKTAIMKMLSYRLLRKLDDPQAIQYIQSGEYFGIYIPMRLDLVSPVYQFIFKNENIKDRVLSEFVLGTNIRICFEYVKICMERLDLLYGANNENYIINELKIVKKLYNIWYPPNHEKLGDTFNDLLSSLIISWQRMSISDPNNEWKYKEFISTTLIKPLISAIELISNDLSINLDKTKWFICIDEAELLNDEQKILLSTLLRQSNYPLIIKIASTPYGFPMAEFAAPEQDFSIVTIDNEPKDFHSLANDIVQKRLKLLKDFPKCKSIEDFVGRISDNEHFQDYFFQGFHRIMDKSINRRNILYEDNKKVKKLIEIYNLKTQTEKNALEPGIKEWQKELYHLLANELNDYQKRMILNELEKGSTIFPLKIQKGIIDKKLPIFYLKTVKSLSKGRSMWGLYSGAKTIISMSDGNPRKLLEILSRLFKKALSDHLTPRVQQAILQKYANDWLQRTKYTPKYGNLVYKYILNVALSLEKQTHEEKDIENVGCDFIVGSYGQKTEDFSKVRKIFETACDYSALYPIPHPTTIYPIIESTTRMRLSYSCAPKFWLLLRVGGNPNLDFNRSPDPDQATLGEYYEN